MTAPSSSEPAQTPEMAHVVERNIQTLLDHQQAQDKDRSFEERFADTITGFAGSMHFIYLHLLLFTVWIVINLGWLPIRPFDPSLAVLAVIASFEAIFLSVFVLISQNRMAAMADSRAKLDLQISLLAEHEVTQILKLVAGIAERVEVDLGDVSELNKLAQDIHPNDMMETIETVERDQVEREQVEKQG